MVTLYFYEVLQEGERVAFTNNPDTWVYRASLHHLEISCFSMFKFFPTQTAPDTWVYRASLHLGVELVVFAGGRGVVGPFA